MEHAIMLGVPGASELGARMLVLTSLPPSLHIARYLADHATPKDAPVMRVALGRLQGRADFRRLLEAAIERTGGGTPLGALTLSRENQSKGGVSLSDATTGALTLGDED